MGSNERFGLRQVPVDGRSCCAIGESFGAPRSTKTQVFVVAVDEARLMWLRSCWSKDHVI